jgi:hypothetical protein
VVEFKLFLILTITRLHVVFYFSALLPIVVPDRCTVVVSGIQPDSFVIANDAREPR